MTVGRLAAASLREEIMMYPKKSILVVEDDIYSAQMLAEMLAFADYTVSTAGTLDEAIGALKSQVYDAALLDLTLPGVATRDIIEQVRGVAGLPPLVVFSALVVEDVRAAAEQLGAAAVLQKPARMEAILATMSRVTGAPSQPGAPAQVRAS